MSVCPLASSAADGGDGIRVVDVETVRGLAEALARVSRK
jgi:hypothetical protein